MHLEIYNSYEIILFFFLGISQVISIFFETDQLCLSAYGKSLNFSNSKTLYTPKHYDMMILINQSY